MQPSPCWLEATPRIEAQLEFGLAPGFALHGRGEIVAILRVDTVALVASDCVRTIDLEGAKHCTFIGDELWIEDGNAVRAFGLDGTELRAPLEVASLGAGRLVAGRSPAIAIWSRAAGDAVLIDADRRGRIWSVRGLNSPAFDGAIQLIPTADRRILAISPTRVVLCTEQGRELVTCTVPPQSQVVAAATILGGRVIAMLARDAQGAVVAVHDWNGRQARLVRVFADCRAVAFAEDAAMAVVARDRELAAIDLRLGITRATAPSELSVRGLAISSTGASLVVCGPPDVNGERPFVQIAIADARWCERPRPESSEASEPTASTTTEPVREEAATLAIVPSASDERGTYHETAALNEPVTPRESVANAEAPRTIGTPPHRPRLRFSRGGAEGGPIRDALEAVTRHAGLLYERLIFAARGTGLLPKASSSDPLAGLAVDDEELGSILSSVAGDATDADPYVGALVRSRVGLRDALAAAEEAGLGLALAVRSFALADGELDTLVIALAPDLDLRFVRVAGFLANDMSRGRPAVGHLAIADRLGLGEVGVERDVAALEWTGLVERSGDGPAANCELRIPAPLVELLASAVAEMSAPGLAWRELVWPAADHARVRLGVGREVARTGRLVLLCGPPGSGRTAIAAAAATEAGMPLVVAELDAPAGPNDARRRGQLLAALVRARIANAALAIRWRGMSRDPLWRVAHTRATDLGVPCLVIASTSDLEGIDPDVPFVRFDAPTCDPECRRALWLRALAEHCLVADAEVVDDLATRYLVTPGRLFEAVAELRARDTGDQVTIEDVRDTLGSISVGRLGNLAVRHRAGIRLEDLAFPEAVSSRITELVGRVSLRRRVLSDWSFADRTHDGYGVSALFVGPPGTGKTAAAAAISNALGIDLHVVDLSRIMSKWVGETEQNLARVFEEAEASNVALLFDEADALFGKRSSDQRGGADRYANVTINYLLQRMESYSGLAILTTNLMSSMDAAFQRRITSIVHFPPSDEDMRLALWRKLLPAGARFAPDVDVRAIARAYELEAAHIRRALVRAAFRVASRGQREPVIHGGDLAWAAAAEYEDLGRIAPRLTTHHRRGDA